MGDVCQVLKVEKAHVMMLFKKAEGWIDGGRLSMAARASHH